MVLVEGEEEGAESERKREREEENQPCDYYGLAGQALKKGGGGGSGGGEEGGGAGKCLLWDVCVVRWGEGVLCCGLGLFL